MTRASIVAVLFLSSFVNCVPTLGPEKAKGYAKLTSDSPVTKSGHKDDAPNPLLTVEKRTNSSIQVENVKNGTTNTTDLEASDSRAHYRVTHASPEYRQRQSYRPHHSPKYAETWNKPQGYQDVVEEEIPRKNDPDYGQHYDSDGHKYDFGYDVKDKEGALTFRKETGDAKSLKGSYGIRDVDGRLRIVRYVADEKGFRAKVETNEPGTGSEDAANVYFNGYDAEKIPSHDVLHKDSGQHSFKHGHYNSHSPLDAGLHEDSPSEDSNLEESGKYHYQYDQIPMEINPAKVQRQTVIAAPLDGNSMDLDDEAASPDHFYKEYPCPYSRFRHSAPHRYSSAPIHPEYRPKRRMDRHMIKYRKLPDFTIPYNTLTGFYKPQYY